jgi:hypothetical protein
MKAVVDCSRPRSRKISGRHGTRKKSLKKLGLAIETQDAGLQRVERGDRC